MLNIVTYMQNISRDFAKLHIHVRKLRKNYFCGNLFIYFFVALHISYYILDIECLLHIYHELLENKNNLKTFPSRV